MRALDVGATLAVMTKGADDVTKFWLASKHSDPYKAKASDNDTGITRGELILNIIWYESMTQYKYIKLDDVCQVSVSSVVVTVSNITWQRTTTNRYYLGEHTHLMIQDLVDGMSEL